MLSGGAGRNGLSRAVDFCSGFAGSSPAARATACPAPRISWTLIKEACANLGVSRGANADEVRAAYRALALRWHQDKWNTGSEAERTAVGEEFRRMKKAFDTLAASTPGKSRVCEPGNSHVPTRKRRGDRVCWMFAAANEGRRTCVAHYLEVEKVAAPTNTVF